MIGVGPLIVLLVLLDCSVLYEAKSIKLTPLTNQQAAALICCETYAPTQELFYCNVYNNPTNFMKVLACYIIKFWFSEVHCVSIFTYCLK